MTPQKFINCQPQDYYNKRGFTAIHWQLLVMEKLTSITKHLTVTSRHQAASISQCKVNTQYQLHYRYDTTSISANKWMHRAWCSINNITVYKKPNHIYLLEFWCKSWRPSILDGRWENNLFRDVLLLGLILLCMAAWHHSTHQWCFYTTQDKHSDINEHVIQLLQLRWQAPYWFHFS